jgi:hypothetical protein
MSGFPACLTRKWYAARLVLMVGLSWTMVEKLFMALAAKKF